ncbi:hypothetical protein JCM6882_007759 [Rhodosporidiobolus microsporus]
MSSPFVSQAFDQPAMTTSAAYASIPLDPLPLDGSSPYGPSSSSSSSYPAYYSLPPADDAYRASSSAYDLSSSQHQGGEQHYAPQYQLPPVSAPPPTSSAPPSSAAMLMQQHQANQQAFRTNQAASATAFQANQYAANQADGTASGSSGSADPSREGSAGSTGSGQLPPNGGPNGDGDFTQTFYDPFKIKHRRRTSPPQLKILEYHFEINSKPDVTLRKALSEQLDMTPREVQVWFQNRRAKVKKLREKAEREAAAAAEEAARKGEVYDPNAAAAVTALNAPANELPIPPSFAPSFQPAARTIYGQQDLQSLRRGSSPAIFGGSSALPTPPPAFDNPFQPLPTSVPFQHLPPNQSFPPPPPNAYPSPVSLATPSPNDFLGGGVQELPQPPPTAVPAYLAGEIAAGPVGGISRRFSLPAYNSGYLPPSSDLPLQQQQPAPIPLPPPQPRQQLGVPHSLVPHPPAHTAYAVSAPTESSYLDQLQPPLPAQIDALSLTSNGLDGSVVSLDGHSPSSSLGEPTTSWDGHTQPFPLDGVPEPQQLQPQFRATYAPSVPSQLGSRRASCPGGPEAFGHQQQQPQHSHFAQPFAPSHQPDTSSASPFYGYSMAPSSAPALPSPHVSPHPAYAQPLPPNGVVAPSFSRRGSVAALPGLSLGTIAEQPPLPHFDPAALSGALSAAGAQPNGSSQTPSPPGGQPVGLTERRGSVIRKTRSTRENLHSPYAAAVQEQRSAYVDNGPSAGL